MSLIILISLLLSYSSIESSSYSKRLLRRQILDGTAKNAGVAPKPPGSDHSFQQSTSYQAIPTMTITAIVTEESINDRSIKDKVSSNSNSKTSLIASILAPTGIVGVIGAVIGAVFYKKNQTNSSTNNIQGLFSKFFASNSNAIVENKSEEKYLLVGNIS